jgi:hypothetical protein
MAFERQAKLYCWQTAQIFRQNKQLTIPIIARLIFILAKKYIPGKSILKLVKLQSLIAKCCKMRKILPCKVRKFCIILYWYYCMGHLKQIPWFSSPPDCILRASWNFLSPEIAGFLKMKRSKNKKQKYLKGNQKVQFVKVNLSSKWKIINLL